MSSWRKNHSGGLNKTEVLCLPSPITLSSTPKYYNTFNSTASNMDLCWNSFHEEKNAAVAVSWPKQIPLEMFERMLVFHRAHMAHHVQLHRAVPSSQQWPATASRPCFLSQGRTVLEHSQPDWGAAQHTGFMKGRRFQRRKRFAGETGWENGIVAPSLQVL